MTPRHDPWVSAARVESGQGCAVVKQVRAFLERYGPSRFEVIEGPPCETREQAGYRRIERDEWLVFPEAWREQVCRGLDPRLAARALVAAGFLEHGVSRSVKVRGVTSRFYVISGSILDGVDPTGPGRDSRLAPESDTPEAAGLKAQTAVMRDRACAAERRAEIAERDAPEAAGFKAQIAMMRDRACAAERRAEIAEERLFKILERLTGAVA